MKSKIILSLTTVALLVSVSVFAKGGQHNDKTCYVTLNDGSTTSSPCSARGTSCLDNFSCTIDGIPGMGAHKKKILKARKLISKEPLRPTKKTLVKKEKTKRKTQDYNSSHSNNSLIDKTDENEKKIKRCLKKNKKLNRADCVKKLSSR